MQQHGHVQFLLRELRQDFVALLLVGGVDVEVLRLAAEFFYVAADFGDVLESRLAVQVHARDIIARLREGPGRAFAESTRGPENERPFRSLHLGVCSVWHGGIIAPIQ